MKLLKHNSRRHSFKAKQRRTVLPPQSAASRYNGSSGTLLNGVNTQARYIRAGYKPAAFIRNGIIGGGEGPGASGLYQINDRIYTTSKMFLRDAYMYPRQAGQSMDPRFPYELHEFPEETGAAALQLVAVPKVHISGEYLANSGTTSTAAKYNAESNNNTSSLSRRNVRKAATEINLANEIYSMQKLRLDGESRHSRSNSLGRSVGEKDRDQSNIPNEAIKPLSKYAESGRGSPQSISSIFRRKKGDRTTWEYHTVSVTRVPGYGFGIAVSGGRDNPHFANGDPSIAVSDVLKGGPAEDRLQVNDRIISVNGVSLENVEYATAVQVLRDSGNTVALVVKRRVTISSTAQSHSSHVMTSVGGAPTNTVQTATAMSQPNTLNTSLVQNHSAQPIKVTLSRGNKKDDYGVVLGCRLFIKEISAKARDQLTANGYSLQEGDVITRIHNTNCGDTMSLKEAKKIIDGCKERLNLVVLRDITNQAVTAMTNQLNNSTTQSNLYASHQTQISNCSNNLDDPYLSGGANYSSQNLYVQPPTRGLGNGVSNGLNDEKSNLTPRGRSRGPIMDGVSLSQLDRPVTPPNGSRTRTDEPPRPPPPRCSGTGSSEDFYSTRRQVTESDQLTHQRQSSEPRFISFQKEGSVGIRLTGGNESGIYVTAVQPGSPASLQGLTPGDKILKVNDMDMHGVTREEAVLFLLSLQDRIDLIVQYCKEDYDEVVANQRGDSFHIKTHFHCDNPSKGEMAFKAGDVFRVIDTLHNGVVGSWQVLKIGRGHQEMQRGVIPNKSRAEELATAQFNANKKEMNSNESRGNFFRRRRSTHRRSKSLSRENWDDVVFADSISKFPAYERVVLRHPGFVRPLVLFGPISDLAREKLAKDFSDKFSVPLQDDDKSNSKCRIIRLSNIRDIMDRGKHALLDITPNAVDRLNYAQLYPIVIFLKTDSKHVIKQLRHGLPKAAHKSSKKLLEQCQKLERVWSHIFSTQIVLNDEESWYRKLRDAIDLQQSGAVWMSESKFPTSTNEMIFTPHFEPPYNFPCYRPISSSVPRCSISRRNSFSLLTNQRSLTPPRPPPLSHEINYESITNTPAGELNEHTCFYKVVPILKPSSSMPGGLATKHSVMQLSSGNTSNMAVGRVTSQYHSSQPNLLSAKDNKNQENAVRHDSLSIKNITSAINGLTMNNSIDDNINNAKSDGAIYAGSTRNIGRTPHTVEPRTTAYYYNELIKKPAIFDSKLNLLNDTLIERNGVQECIPHHSADSVETAGERIINHNDQKTETYSPCMKSQNKQNNNGNDASTSINIGNTRCGRSYNDCNGNIDSSNAINNSPYGNNPKIAAQLEGKPVPTPAIRNFTITNLPSASLLKNSTLSSMHSHNINKTSYYTSTKLSKSSGESNINFGSSNERIA
uniref:Tight junction protein ZO-2 n=1 Tax=Ceratitis capitata TaxID=7213 RepID=W8B9N9_CERCA